MVFFQFCEFLKNLSIKTQFFLFLYNFFCRFLISAVQHVILNHFSMESHRLIAWLFDWLIGLILHWSIDWLMDWCTDRFSNRICIFQVMTCGSCGKSLPRCALCQIHMGTPTNMGFVTGEMDDAGTFCLFGLFTFFPPFWPHSQLHYF